jgi:hypothetical protein
MAKRMCETRRVWCKVCDSSYSCKRDTLWLGESGVISCKQARVKMLAFLWLLKSNATQESTVYNELAQETTLAGLLYKYTTNTAYRKCGMKGNDWFTGFVRKNANLSLKQYENLSYDRLMRFNREVLDSSKLGYKQWKTRSCKKSLI